MEDRFRFRAWFKPEYREPIMLYDVEQTYDFMRGSPENVPEDCFGDVLADKDYIVMQCTGLKDKNGKLIYEGDIVEEGLKCVIEWDKECCGFVEVHTNRLNQQKIFYPMFDNTDESRNTRCEVIGNIYENKELLND